MRILNRQNKIKSPRRAPQWSKANLKKKEDYREGNKEKLAERDRKRPLYKQYKLLEARKISTLNMDAMEPVNAKESPDIRIMMFLVGKTKPKEPIIGKVINREKISKG